MAAELKAWCLLCCLLLLSSFFEATSSSTTQLECPTACKCTIGNVDCTLAGLSEWPIGLPSNTSTLILSRNRLRRITKENLSNYPQLKKLVISYNRIELIDKRLEHNQLETLDVSFNAVADLEFLFGLPKLRHLNATSNKIGILENTTFIRSSRLQWLSLDYNPIQKFESGLFRRNEQIAYLSLSGLQVDSLPARLLDPLTRLQQLEIRDNQRLTGLRDDIFHYLGNSLRYLNLANNSLESLPRSLRQLDTLRELNMDKNPFSCDCRLFWFAHWLEKRSSLTASSAMICSTGQPLVDSLWRLHCSAVRLETSTLFQEQNYGQPVVLTCNFSGNPSPSVTWITPDKSVLNWASANSSNNIQNQSVTLLSSGQLQVNGLSRQTAGDYACHASNALSNVTAFMRVHIKPTGFRRVQLQSIATGFGCVAAFVLITLIVQGFRYIMDRFGWWDYCYCCGERLSPRAKQIRNLLEAIEQYKSQQLERLRENYNGQVTRIRDNCVQQMERIQQGYSGQVKYLRGVRDYGTQQLTTIREQYNDQAKKVYDYTVERLHTVQRNYVSQRQRVRKFSAHQLIRLREKYKFQQKTLNKIMENLPAFYIDACRSAACARTDSIYFQDGCIVGVGETLDVDVVESIIKQGIQLDLPDDVMASMLEDDLEIPATEAIDPLQLQQQHQRKKSGHGRQPSAGSLDFNFLFPPIRFPSLNWRRRNTVDEEEQQSNEEGNQPLKVAVDVELYNPPQCSVPIEESHPLQMSPEAEGDSTATQKED